MDYAVGSVAALVSGNVTPNRPRLIRRALTPTKHPASPNVTPKSEYVDDKSIFLSPSLQRKKAIVKKSPKRIFQNPDLEVTNDGDSSSVLLSPKADKVKKHLKDDLEANQKSPISPKSPKKGKGKQSENTTVSKIKSCINPELEDKDFTETKSENESTPKKKKKQRNSTIMPAGDGKENLIDSTEVTIDESKSPKNKRKSLVPVEMETEKNCENTKKLKKKNKKSLTQETENAAEDQTKKLENHQPSKKNRKKNKNKAIVSNDEVQNKTNKPSETQETKNHTEIVVNQQTKKKKNKKGKNKNVGDQEETEPNQKNPKKKTKSKTAINPNAITNKESDSEHESDNELESENEQANNEILDTGPAGDSSEDEQEDVQKEQKKEKRERSQDNSVGEVKRTLFVGNVPFNKKCKKEVKKIFNKYGQIETVRIRTIPVKDARMTPKVAAITNVLHPERSTVNCYVRFKDADSVQKALVENNTVLNNNHLRVTRSDITGTEHDPNKAIFLGNLPFAIEDDGLRAKFERCGEIESVRIVRDNKTNAGKGFGYINFASKDGVELALAMSEEDLTIKNRILRVKRCSITNKQQTSQQGNSGRFHGNQRSQPRSQGVMKRNQESGNPSFGRGQDFRGNQEGRNPGTGNFGRNQGGFGRNQGGFGRNQGGFGSNPGGFGRNQGGFGRNEGSFAGNEDRNQDDRRIGQDGAHRRILSKRRNEEVVGPASKRPHISQPVKEKKARKEFVGITAEKKKKQKFNKGDKKKKALSEILTKHNS